MTFFSTTRTITFAHREVHEGDMYNVSHVFTLAGSPLVAEILIDNTANSKSLHTNFGIDADGDAEHFLFEDTTVSASGTSLSAIQLNRDSSNTSGVLAFHTPTVTSDGTLLRHVFVPSGLFAPWGAGGDGAPVRGGTETILATGKRYLLRATVNVATTVGLEFSFYEHIPLP